MKIINCLQILILFVLTITQNVLSQSCDNGWTYDSSINGCKIIGASNPTFTISTCQYGGTTGPLRIEIGNTSTSQCQSGWTTVQSRSIVVVGNSFTLSLCFYSMIGFVNGIYYTPYSCAASDLYTGSVITYSFDSINRFFVVSECQRSAIWGGLDFIFQTNSLPSDSATNQFNCKNVPNGDGTFTSDPPAYIIKNQIWEHAVIKCPIGYGPGYPSCTQDIDECTTPGICGTASCVNSVGSYQCSCQIGYGYNSVSKSCVDNDECTTTPGICGTASCVNSIGSYQCSCQTGYEYNPVSKSCVDTDECTTSTICGTATCTNSIGSYQCSCGIGYNYNSVSKSCDDIDECTLNTSGCSQGCTNTDGSYQCSCNQGYQLNSNGKSCDDIDECVKGTSGCSNTCTNLPLGSFTCSCQSGYKLDTDLKSCIEINECTEDTSGCEQTCTNLPLGSFTCSCQSGYKLGTDNKSCQDIDECSSQTLNKCLENTICKNTNGSYECPCNPSSYSHSNSLFQCAPKPVINSFYQKGDQLLTFVLVGDNFNGQLDSKITIGDESLINCEYILGNSTYIECATIRGLEVIGNVTIKSNSILSDSFNFIGSPFIKSISHNVSTSGNEDITIYGNNFPVTGSVSLLINSINCPISTLNIDSIVCKIGEGTGALNNIILSNELVSNTDNVMVIYANPIIESTSVVYTNGGVLTVTGNNFGPISNSKVSLDIGGINKCSNVNVLTHTLFTCELPPYKEIHTQVINLIVDGLSPDGTNYFIYSTLESSECKCEHGKCTSYGCDCETGFTGVSCNETSIGITPKPPTDIPSIPSIEIGDNINNNFGYKVSIIRIEELDFNQNIIQTYQLLNETSWTLSNTSTSNWIFNTTLPNNSNLEATFEYYRLSTNISFAKSSFIVPAESLKLSFKTQSWPFTSKLNSLRIVVSTDTLILSDSDECSINTPINTQYNQHLWSTIQNPDTGITARFISAAEVDGIPITANIELLSSPIRTSSIIGISVPYFKSESIIDPDFSVLLSNSETSTGICKKVSPLSSNWRIATGVSVGAGCAVVIAGASAYYIRQKKKNDQLNQKFNIKN